MDFRGYNPKDMNVALRLESDTLSMEAGTTLALTVEIANRGEEEDSFELMVEGIDATWAAIPVPTFTLGAHDLRNEKILLRPPRESESLAADYPFVVRVRSLSTGETERVPVVMQLKPYHNLSLDASPKKGIVTAFQPQTTFEVTVMNLGNSAHQVQLSAGDLDDTCIFEFVHDKVTVSPGQQLSVDLQVRPSRKRWVGSSRLNGVTVTARSTMVPTVAASSQVQLEQRPATSPGALLVILLFLVLAVGWWLNMPKPPAITGLQLSQSESVVGQPVTITWRAEHATSVDILVNGALLKSSIDATGSVDYVPGEAKQYEIGAVAKMEGRESAMVTRPLMVKAAPLVAAPVIESFRIEPTQANVGDRLLVTYKFNAAVTKATLSPNNIDLNPKVNALEVDVLREGDIVYKIVAENERGDSVERTVKVTVVKKSAARVILFRSEPTTAPAENAVVKLEWQLSNAVRAEIAYGAENVVVDARQGSIDVAIDRKTIITLTAYDQEGRTVRQTLTVDVAKPVEPKPADDVVPPPAGVPDPASGPGGEMPPAGTTGGNR